MGNGDFLLKGDFYMKKTIQTKKSNEKTKPVLNKIKSNIKNDFLNSIFSEEAFAKSCIGVWRIDYFKHSRKSDNPSKMYLDKYLSDLLEIENTDIMSPEEVYQNFFSHISDENLVIFKEAYRKLLLGDNIELSVFLTTGSGKNINLRINGRKKDNIEDCIRFEGVCRDMTNLLVVRNNSERTVFFTEVANVLSEIYDIVFYVDLKTNNYYEYNTNDLLNKSRPIFSGKDFFKESEMILKETCHPDDLNVMFAFTQKEYIVNNLKNGKLSSPVYRVKNIKDESSFNHCRMKVVKAQTDAHHLIICFENAEEEIRNQERDMAVIASLSDDFGCIVYVDLSTYEEIHYRLDPVFEKQIPGWHDINNFEVRLNTMANNVVHPEDRDVFLNTTQKEKVLDELSSQKSVSTDFRLIIGGEIIYYRAKFVKDDRSENHIIAGFKNIDREKRKELAAIQKAEAANRAKTVFLSNMSHDIRTPLNAITGFIELAIRNIDNPEKTLDYLKKAQLSNRHMIDIINNILDMSKIESGKISLEESRQDIMLYGNDILPMLTNLAENKKINFRFSFGNIRNRYLYFDNLKLNKAIINVISNAIKYTDEGGTVKLTILEEDTEFDDHGIFDFIIEDTGCGMSSSFISKAFDSFTREKASVGKEPGTGLGLAITKNLIELMGGSITVTSQLDIGSKFTISVPLKFDKDANVNFENFEEIPDPDYFQGKRILVAEDNDLNREILTSILEDAGMNIDEAVNGLEAVNLIQKKGTGYYDCILMDIQMPEMDGYTATKEIRKLHTDKRIPIIALSANAFDEDRKRSFESDMDDHQAKPIIVPKLLACMKKYI